MQFGIEMEIISQIYTQIFLFHQAEVIGCWKEGGQRMGLSRELAKKIKHKNMCIWHIFTMFLSLCYSNAVILQGIAWHFGKGPRKSIPPFLSCLYIQYEARDKEHLV